MGKNHGLHNLAFNPGLLDVLPIPAPSASAPTVGQMRELPALPEPKPFLFPPIPQPNDKVSKMPGPSQHPPLAASCPTGAFFGDPPSRAGQTTKGRVLSPGEAAMKKSVIEFAIAAAKPTIPLAAENLQHWLDGTGATKVLPAAPFKSVESGVPDYLANKARNIFENGFTERLKNANHPQGTMRPATLTAGMKGPVRFLQRRDGGLQASSMGSNASKNLFAAVGKFNIQTVMWAQATFIKSTGLFVKDDIFEVEILRWCVQIYDVYDWNNNDPLIPLLAPFSLTDAEFATMKTKVTLPLDGVLTLSVSKDFNVVKVADRLLSELEVSGVGKAYLVRSDVFEAPSSVRGKFTATI